VGVDYSSYFCCESNSLSLIYFNFKAAFHINSLEIHFRVALVVVEDQDPVDVVKDLAMDFMVDFD
jgi:hypothetical protein